MHQPQNILLCCEQYPPSIGGVQEVMRQIAERLAAMGHQVTVATSQHPDRAFDVIRNGVRVVSFDISGNAVKGMTGDIGKYQKFLRESDFDAILIKAAQQWSFDACVNVLNDLRARKTFIPCGFSALHDPKYTEYYAEMPNWLKKFDALIFYSNTYHDIQFARQHGLDQLHVVPNGVDEREFFSDNVPAAGAGLGLPNDTMLLLTVGTLIIPKGHWEVIKAYRRAIIDRPSCLVINGNRPREFLLRKIVRSIRDAARGYLPLSITIKFFNMMATIGAQQKSIKLVDLERGQLVSLYREADLFVFGSHVEYSPLVLFESAAAGTPFISNDVGNAKEIADWTGLGTVVCGETRVEMDVVAVDDTLLARQLENACNSLTKIPMDEMFQRFTDSGLTWAQIATKYWVIMKGSSVA
ncbi:glycosyltransferase involved in cell wall biosynthesis [Sphingorhabdus rigui]|uniref:Glycosyltransferase involved in cell wall biosynthesis n=1 Tax=Sphingorhabdus rigui TaxID=1282858 RepID=A0A840B009_9SPHN|nr:glycosyltransferase involved in cell wall biosynthesis [Sphingorhabdus rigui]